MHLAQLLEITGDFAVEALEIMIKDNSGFFLMDSRDKAVNCLSVMGYQRKAISLGLELADDQLDEEFKRKIESSRD